MVDTRKNEKMFLIVGYGILGKVITEQLSRYGKVIITDIKDPDDLHKSFSRYTYLKYQSDGDFIKNLSIFFGRKFDCIVHTFLGSPMETKQFCEQIKDTTHSFCHIGTLMTYDPITWEKVNPHKDFFWNRYMFNKRVSEQILEKACDNAQINFYCPQTFHLLGPGYGIGIVGPYFRMNRLELDRYKEHSTLVLSNNEPKNWIDHRDFAKIIAGDIIKQTSGYKKIINPKLIYPLEYYQLLDDLLNISRPINTTFDKAAEPKCMNIAWDCKTDISFADDLTSLEQSIADTVEYLQDKNNPLTRDIRSVMSDENNQVSNLEIQNTQFLPIKYYKRAGSWSADIIYGKKQQDIESHIYRFFGRKDALDNVSKKVVQRRKSLNNAISQIKPDILIDLGGGWGIAGLDYLHVNPQAVNVVIDFEQNCRTGQKVVDSLFVELTKRCFFVTADLVQDDLVARLDGILDLTNNHKIAICNQGLIRYIEKHSQSRLFANVTKAAEYYKRFGQTVYWINVDTELASKYGGSNGDVSSLEKITNATNVITMSNLPKSIVEIQKYFIQNNWAIRRYEAEYILGEYFGLE